MKPSNPSSDPESELSAFEQPQLDSPDIQEIHRAVLREQFEPQEGQQRVPVLLFIGFLGLSMWAGWYLSEYDGNFQPNVYDGPDAFRQIDLSKSTDKTSVAIDPKLLGKRIYNNCVSCHQATGLGIAGQYPPLDASEWVTGDDRILARILLNGLSGPLLVGGKTYNAQMPAWSRLSDRDIASVLTYIRSSWSNTAAPVDEATIAKVRLEIGGRTNSFTAAELQSLDQPVIDIKYETSPKNTGAAP